ncbi:MAG: sialidase family protein [Pirellulales bacterium]
MVHLFRNAIAVLVFCGGLWQASAKAHEPIVLSDPPTEGPSHKAGLLTLPNGAVEVYYLRESENGKEIASRQTVDDGRSWSEPKSVLALPGSHVGALQPGDWIIVRPLRTKDGELHFFLLRCGNMGARPGADQFISAWYVGSRDGRTRWHGPKLVFEGSVGPPRCAVELPGGRILYPFDHAIGDRDTHHPTGIGEVMCAYSDDGGESWQFSPSNLTVPVDHVYQAPNYGALEPVIAPLDDGRLWMVLRSPNGRLYESFSVDDGTTWESAGPTRFYSSNSPADILRLNDGRLALFWNNTQNAPSIDGSEPYTNRDVVHAAISNDEGRTWYGYREIYRAPHRNISPPEQGTTWGTSYPDVAVTKSNKLLVMVGHGPDSAKMILVDPDWLMATNAEDHFLDGLEKWCVYKGVGPIESAWRERVTGASLIPHPDRTDTNVLHVRRPKGEPADGAVWNFPKGKNGTLRLKIRLQPGFGGASIALADRYYDPTDVTGERQALFDLRVSNYRQLMSGFALEVDKWYVLELKWDIATKTCAVIVDSEHLLDLEQLNPSTEGANYLRLRSLDQATGDGFLIEFVDVQINDTGDQPPPQAAVENGRAKADGAPRIVSSFEAEPRAGYPFRQNMYRALQLKDGRIVAISIARNHEQRQQTMQARYSKDNGAIWSEPEDLFEWPKEAGGFGLFEALVDQKGEIQIVSLCDQNTGIMFPKAEGTGPPTYNILEIWQVRSKNGIKGWSVPKRIREGKAGDLLSITQMSNGRIVLPICFPTGRTLNKKDGSFQDFTYMGQYSCGSMHSDDNGETWHESPVVLSVETPDLHTWGCDEPSVIQLKDGRVWMLMRTQQGRFYESFSQDGAHWSPAHPSKLVSSDSPAGLLRLKDGSLLLLSNACRRYPYAYGARYVLHGAISRDDGRTWHGFREIARDPHRNKPPSMLEDYGISYSFPTQTVDGKVLLSNWVEQGSVRHFRLFNPEWLLETKQDSDFSEGLEDWSVFGSKGVELRPDTENVAVKVLALRKAEAYWPAAAVWNFPMGSKGLLRLNLKLNEDFGGVAIGLTDHFSVPWDLEAEFHNAFNLPIAASGELLPGAKLGLAQWHDLDLAWDTEIGECEVYLDGRQVGTIKDNRRTSGVNYVRFRSTSAQPDGGLVIRSVTAEVSASETVKP